jgi:hypothetical protein
MSISQTIEVKLSDLGPVIRQLDKFIEEYGVSGEVRVDHSIMVRIENIKKLLEEMDK